MCFSISKRIETCSVSFSSLLHRLRNYKYQMVHIRFNSATDILALIALLVSAGPVASENPKDWITGLPRETIHVKEWPGGKKVAVFFVLYVEVWGLGHGPNFRPDMVSRDPDVVDESVRQYAIEWGVPRVGRLFNKQSDPLSIALNALFPENHPDNWKQFRSLVPKAPIIAHGINNSTQTLPLKARLECTTSIHSPDTRYV